MRKKIIVNTTAKWGVRLLHWDMMHFSDCKSIFVLKCWVLNIIETLLIISPTTQVVAKPQYKFIESPLYRWEEKYRKSWFFSQFSIFQSISRPGVGSLWIQRITSLMVNVNLMVMVKVDNVQVQSAGLAVLWAVLLQEIDGSGGQSLPFASRL